MADVMDTNVISLTSWAIASAPHFSDERGRWIYVAGRRLDGSLAFSGCVEQYSAVTGIMSDADGQRWRLEGEFGDLHDHDVRMHAERNLRALGHAASDWSALHLHLELHL